MKEILEKAIQKAIDSGWNNSLEGYGDDIMAYVIMGQIGSAYDAPSLNELIFNHDFAVALWGEELYHHVFIVPQELSKRFAGTQDLDIKPIWQYHLQQMVISDDPIEYLGKHI